MREYPLANEAQVLAHANNSEFIGMCVYPRLWDPQPFSRFGDSQKLFVRSHAISLLQLPGWNRLAPSTVFKNFSYKKI